LLAEDKPLSNHFLNDLNFLLSGSCVHIYTKSERRIGNYLAQKEALESWLSLNDEAHVVKNLGLIVFLNCDLSYDELVELHSKDVELIRLNNLCEDLTATDVDFEKVCNIGKMWFECLLAVSVVIAEPEKEVHRKVKHLFMSLPVVVNLLEQLIDQQVTKVNLKRKVLYFAALHFVFARVNDFGHLFENVVQI